MTKLRAFNLTCNAGACDPSRDLHMPGVLEPDVDAGKHMHFMLERAWGGDQYFFYE